MCRPALLGAGLLALAVAGCGTDYDGTRERAEEQAAASAYDVADGLRDLVRDGRAPTGDQLLALVRTGFPGQAGLSYAFAADVLPDGAVTYAMAFDGFDESGGGGTYHQYLARVCVEYVVRGGRDPGVTMADTECSADLLQPTGPTPKADATFPLPARDPSPAAPTNRRSCQEHSGDPNTCPG